MSSYIVITNNVFTTNCAIRSDITFCTNSTVRCYAVISNKVFPFDCIIRSDIAFCTNGAFCSYISAAVHTTRIDSTTSINILAGIDAISSIDILGNTDGFYLIVGCCQRTIGINCSCCRLEISLVVKRQFCAFNRLRNACKLRSRRVCCCSCSSKLIIQSNQIMTHSFILAICIFNRYIMRLCLGFSISMD